MRRSSFLLFVLVLFFCLLIFSSVTNAGKAKGEDGKDSATSLTHPETITYNKPLSLSGTLEAVPCETPDGKHKAHFPALRLAAKITVKADSKSELSNETEQNVDLIQLVLTDDKLWPQFKTLIGKNVSVSGSLYHSHTGHHYTKVLCDVSSIEEIVNSPGNGNTKDE